MDVVLDHVLIVLDFTGFDAFLVEGSVADLATEDLAANKIVTSEYKLHLVKDELNLLSRFKRTVSLDLDFLDDVASSINLAIFFKHFD